MPEPKVLINFFTSVPNQYLETSNRSFPIPEDKIRLGLDAEILPELDGKILWPHVHECPQQRGNAKWKYHAPEEISYHQKADWHGDGYAFELCTEPVVCLDYQMATAGRGFLFLAKKLSPKAIQLLKMKTPAVYEVPGRVAASAPEEVRMLGCMPSLNVYDDAGEPTGLGDESRTTGCHLHASHRWITNDTVESCVRWADIITGNAWNYISDELPETEAFRRKAYGRAGEHRRNKYPSGEFGFEYRVLPGRVLSNPIYLTLMFNSLRWAIKMAYHHGQPDKLVSLASRAAINKADKLLSKAILDEMPLTPQSRAYLNYLAENPQPILSPYEWYSQSLQSYGHQKHYLDLSSKGKLKA